MVCRLLDLVAKLLRHWPTENLGTGCSNVEGLRVPDFVSWWTRRMKINNSDKDDIIHLSCLAIMALSWHEQLLHS